MKRPDPGALLERRASGGDWSAAHSGVIVAATDFTPVASAAARRAAQLAHSNNARLALLHVVGPAKRMVAPLLDALGVSSRPSPGEALARLGRIAARLKAEFRLPVDARLASGAAPVAVAEHAHKAAAELVVLGNRRGNFLVDLLRINTAQRVRRRLAVPVLAVSRPAGGPYSRVALATDLSPDSAHAGRIARRLFPAALHYVLHVCQPPYEGTLALAGVGRAAVEEHRRKSLEEAQIQLQKFARDAYLGVDAGLEVRVGDPAAQIRGFVADEGIDVVVLCPARSWLARGMANSVTEQLLADPPCDALLVG